jgi:hypothetical protein
MPILQGRPGAQTPKDNVYPDVRVGPWGELGTSDMSGFFAEQIARGNGYCFPSALAGVALIASTNTTNNKMMIWNPPTSGRVLLLQCVRFGRTAVGATPLEGSIVYARAQGILSASPITGTTTFPCDIISYTKASAVNLRSDIVGDASGMLFAPALNSIQAAPTLWAASGIAQTADNGATTVEGPQVQYAVDWIWGLLQLWPGTLMCVSAAVAILTTYTIGIYALSLPKPDFA